MARRLYETLDKGAIMEEKIQLHCTDKDQFVEGSVLSRTDQFITVILPGPNKLTLKKIKPNMYVGNFMEFEFVYKDTNK